MEFNIVDKNRSLADAAFQLFDFDTYEVVDHDGWEFSSPNLLSKVVYIAAEDSFEPSERVTFNVTFYESGEINEVYALLMSNGMEVGNYNPSEFGDSDFLEGSSSPKF